MEKTISDLIPTDDKSFIFGVDNCGDLFEYIEEQDNEIQ